MNGITRQQGLNEPIGLHDPRDLHKASPELASVLLVGLDAPRSPEAFEESELTVAMTGRGALEMLRVMRFDLVLAAPRLPDMPTWELVGAIRSLWPWQKWALVGAGITQQQEICARTLGVTGVFDELPSRAVLLAIARSARRSQTGAATSRPSRRPHVLSGHQ